MAEIPSMRNHVRVAVSLIKDYIDKHPFEFSFPFIDDIIPPDYRISRKLLQKSFRQMHQSSIKDYLKNRRMEACLSLLEEGKPLAQIARKCGYGSQSSFTRAFRRRFGQTPTEWEKHHPKSNKKL